VLAVVCSALAFLLMVGLIAEIGPVKATTITYVNPAVAIIAGVVVLGERVTIWTIVGFLLVLAGSYLVTRKRQEAVVAEGAEAAVAEQTATGSASTEQTAAETATEQPR
jgi:drug/metabolite transporter (DMT)-like permease